MVLHVSQTGAPGHFSTISAAVAAASPGETIIVGDGVYTEDVVITKSLVLLSQNGQWNESAGTGVKIVGIAGGALGTVTISNTSGVTVGAAGQGFTIIGKDGTPAVENSAVYLQGNVSNITLRGNDVVANGDGGLTSEYGATVTNVTIDNNIFSGQTFNGIPFGQGSSQQFTHLDVPRQLVVMGGTNTSAITFSNNQITGTAGGINAQGQEQGNSLVTLDVVNSTISGNEFTGFTNYGAYALRVRRDGTTITNNTFDSEASGSDNTSQVLVQTANPGMSSGNMFIGSDNNDIIYATAGAGSDSYDGGDGVDTFSFSPAATTGAVADLQSGYAFSGSTGYDTLTNIENLAGTAGNDTFFGDANNNTFFASAGTDSVNGRGGSDTFDSSSYSANTTVNLSTGSASGFGGTTSLTSVENATTGSGNDTLIGTSAANVLKGNAGNDTFTGNGGGDTIVGGEGFDVVNYGAIEAGDFTLDGVAGWLVDTGTGTDSLSGIEQARNADGSKILLVGNGGYATIQEAINAAANGDTVLIAAGTYTGDLTISDKAISLVGVGEVTIEGQISIDDDMVDGDVLTFKNVNIDATGKYYGIDARIDSVGNFGKIVLDDVSIENARQNGFFYTNSQNAASPVNNDTIGAIEVVNGSSFHNNGYYHTGSGGRGHINLFGFNGDLTVSDSDFTTETGRIDSNAITGNAVNPHKAISVSGDRDSGTNGVGPYAEGGNITLTNVTITGDYATDVVSFYDFAAFESFVLTNVDVTARGPWGLLNLDDVGGTVDTSGFTGTNTFAGRPIIAEVKGLASNDTLTGTDGDDIVIGRGGADVLDGGAGNDLIIGGSVGGTSSAPVILDDANSIVDTAVFDGGELSWNGTAWIVTDGSEVDTLYGIERVTIGSDTYLLVDKAANGGFGTIQSAIDYASGGEIILIAEGDYTELANFNPSNGSNTGSGNPVGLLINKSVTLQGVAGSGGDLPKILPGVQSNWGTQVYVTAANVSIIGLEIEASTSVAINKIVEVIANNFTIKDSIVGAPGTATVASTIYINDDEPAGSGFVSDISKFLIDNNLLEGNVVITSGPGVGHANPDFVISNNEFVNNNPANPGVNWGIVITGKDDAVAWRPHDVVAPLVIDNTFGQDFTNNRILYIRGDDISTLPDRDYVDAFLASQDETGTYAFVVQPDGELRYFDLGTTNGFAVHRFAGAASAFAEAGDTVIVSSGSNNDTQVITVDDLTIVALEGSDQLNLELGAGVTTLTVGDYAVGQGEDVMITGNAGDNVITGNSGNNQIEGGAGSDALFGGEGNDTFVYGSAADFGATESVDGGGNVTSGPGAGIDSIVFRAGASETLELNANVTGIEAVMIEANVGGTNNGINAGVDASAVGNALAFFGDNGDNTFVGTAFTDSFSGGDGVDTVVENGAVEYDSVTGTWSLNGQALQDIEIVEGAGGVRTLLVGDGGFDTIEAAVAAANSGDTIMLSADTYNVAGLSITKDLTFLGANDGVDGTDVRGAETILVGPASGAMFGMGAGVSLSIDGVKIVADHIINSGTPGQSFSLTNSVLDLTTNADNNIYFGYGGGYTFTFTNNAVSSTGYSDGLLMLFEGGVINVSDNTFTGISPTDGATSGKNAVAMNINGSATTGASGVVAGNTFTNMDIGVMLAGHIGDLDVTGNGFVSPDGYGTGVLFFDPNYTGEINIDDNTFEGVATGIRQSSFNNGTIEGMDVSADGNIFIDNLQDVRLNGSGVLHLTDSTVDGEAVPSLFVGGISNDTITGSAADDVVLGGNGNDTITGNGGADDLDGGAGNDTFVFADAAQLAEAVSINGGDGTDTVVVNGNAAVTFDTTTDTWTLAGETITDIEIVDVNGAGGVRTLLVGNGGFATIQEAINAANANDTILISEGDYSEQLVISTNGLTIKAIGEVNILGNLNTDLGIGAAGSVADFLATATSYSTNSGSGITVSGSGITLEGLNISRFAYGINLGEGTTNLTVTGVDISDTISGINKATAADVNGVTINGGTITDSYQGIVFAKATAANDGHATGLNINGTHFEKLTEKGIYVETLTNSTFDGITMTNVGEYGRGPAFGGTGPNANGFGAGIDINLKYGTYVGAIIIKNFTFNDVGSSDANGAGTPHGGGAAITVKGRDDANSYNTNPANVAGLTVTIQDGTIGGTSTGIRLGEPGKPNSANNTTGPNLSVTNVVIDDAQYELDNVSKSVLTVTLGANDDNAYDASNAATATGSIVFNGNALANTFTGARGNDVFNGNGGADVFNGGDGDDTAIFTSSADAALATFNGGNGTDTIAFNTTSQTSVVLGSVTLNSVERVTIGGAAVNLDASAKSVGLTLVGNGSANIIRGTSGNDVIQAEGGNDTIKYVLGQGSDSVDGGAGTDTLEVDGKAAASSMTYALTAAGAVLSLTTATSATPATITSTQTISNVEKLKVELSNLGDKVTLSGNLAAAGIAGADAEIRIDAGSGNDVIDASGVVGAAKLVIELGDGDDTFIGGRVDQTVKGGAGLKDMFDFAHLSGGVNFNLGTGALMGAGIGGISSGNTGFEQVRGTAYNDILNGSSTAPTEETFYASLGNDVINGRGGADTYSGTYTRPDGVKESIAHGLYVNLEDGFATDLATTALFTHGLLNIENIVGSLYDDWLVGSSGDNVIDGEAGDDILEGGAGNDTYIANSAGDVVIEEVDGGIDTVITSRGRTTDLWDNVENLTLTGNAVSATGNALNNVIRGNSANNIIDGKAGADTMYGGAGNDSYYVDNINDGVVELFGEGDDIVYSTVSFTLGDNVERLNLTGTASVNATGNALDNIIRGNSGANTITGGAGVDVMTGGSGNDVFVFNLGDTGMNASRDRITDFRHLQDDIDLTSFAGTFTYLGNKADFGTANGSNKVRWFEDGNVTIVEADITNDGVGDFQIQLDGINLGLTFNDFLL